MTLGTNSPLGPQSELQINEWLANPDFCFDRMVRI
ncbi:hypothetical protein BH23VER1_BH23VER1_25200 [soil metagenome]